MSGVQPAAYRSLHRRAVPAVWRPLVWEQSAVAAMLENEVADNMYQGSELSYLIYDAPLTYADLVLQDDPEVYLKAVTAYKLLD